MENVELDYGAITIDNAALKGEGYRFSEGILVQMCQFKDSPVEVIQTDIVHKEAIKHIGQEILKTRTSIEQALRSANKQLKISSADIDKAKDLLSVEGSEHDVAESRLIKYYDFIGAEIIHSEDHVDLPLLMKRYFDTEAPFETGKDKKHEFPDAIALLSIEGWAKKNNINVIAVSEDNGWKRYAENSKRITLVSSISEALEKFQPHNKVTAVIEKLREDSLLDKGNHVLDDIKQAIKVSVLRSDFWVKAISDLRFTFDTGYATYISHEFDSDKEGLVKIRVIRIDDASIVLRVGATVIAEAECDFEFSDRNSKDNVYYGMGDNIYRTTETYHTDILLTLSGDFSQGLNDVSVTNIEVLEDLATVSFGEIEPAWREEQNYF